MRTKNKKAIKRHFPFDRLSPRLSGRPNGCPPGIISPIASTPSRHSADPHHPQPPPPHSVRPLGTSITALHEDNNNVGTPGASTASPSPLSCNPLLGSSEYLKPLHELPRHIGSNGKLGNGVHAPPAYTQGTLF